MKHVFAFIAVVVGCLSAAAQLAITEVMSSANSTPAGQNPDFWELTNFGTNALDLTGYRWNDRDGGLASGADTNVFNGLIIRPGESVLFAQFEGGRPTTNAATFMEWWGTNRFATNAQIVIYTGNGLSSSGDSVVLWAPAATNDADYVDRVDLGAATAGRSFVYDPTNGQPCQLSGAGTNGAWASEAGADQGSPGVTTGPIPLQITQHPTNLTVNAGNTALFFAAGTGLPRAHFQWLHDGSPIEGAVAPTLSIANAQLTNAGIYAVIVSNGVDTLVSSNATLAVNPAPAAPVLSRIPTNHVIFTNQSVTFYVEAAGFPTPTFQWQFNHTNLLNETGPQLTISSAQFEQAGTYTVVVTNLHGGTNSSATLTMTRKPKLLITEVFAQASTNEQGLTLGHGDWWELSNFDDFPVSLQGYRWHDGPSWAGATVITNDTVIRPGESIVFAENLTPAAFRSWWGEGPLSSRLQILRYQSPGLAQAGEVITLWNHYASGDADQITSSSFSLATRGVSYQLDPDIGFLSKLSVPGESGAFVAAELGDIGSPGYLANRPVVLGITNGVAGVDITWSARTNMAYAVEFSTNLDSTNWTSLTNRVADDTTQTTRDPSPATSEAKFYRVVEQP